MTVSHQRRTLALFRALMRSTRRFERLAVRESRRAVIRKAFRDSFMVAFTPDAQEELLVAGEAALDALNRGLATDIDPELAILEEAWEFPPHRSMAFIPGIDIPHRHQ
jgi:hypothetical protein